MDEVAATNSQETLQAVLRLEDQLRSNLVAIEAYGQEAKTAAARNNEALSNGLFQIAETFSTQQETLSARNAQELGAMRRANRVLLLVVGTFAVLASLVMLGIAWLQWRMSRAWAGIAADLPVPRALAHASDLPALAPGDSSLVAAGLVENSNRRLLGAMEQLEKRIQDLEQMPEVVTDSGRPNSQPGGNGDSHPNGTNEPTAEGLERAAADDHARILALLEQGKDKLKENDLEAALRDFDEVLALDPNHSEALVKKGAALERLQRLNEAFACYDRAIAADDSMTIAYLYKGGLCNRLERFKEALECYEKALQTHDERPA